jgi:hypothetical protein
MHEKTFPYKNGTYIIRRLRTDENVVIFKVFEIIQANKRLELRCLYGWVDNKLVELTPRHGENSEILDAFYKEILKDYHLK